MKTRLLSITIPIMVLLFVYMPIGVIASPNLDKGEVILSGLSNPYIMGIDAMGRIYFSEYREEGGVLIGTLKRFNPITKSVEKLVSHEGMKIQLVEYDMRGNIYYVAFDKEHRCKLYKLEAGSAFSQLLYSTSEWIVDMDVDKLGNIYFCQQPYVFRPPSRLMLIPRGEKVVECLVELEDADAILGIQASSNPTLGVYFAARREDGCYLFQYRDGEPRIILKRDRRDNGFIGYTALSHAGSLYYFYRKRSDFNALNQWGYLEIGKFTVSDVKRERGPTILLTEEFDGKAVWVFYYLRCLFDVSATGDVFFIQLLYDGRGWSTELVWLNTKAGVYHTLVKSTPPQPMTFVLDHQENIYYTLPYYGEIIRISRVQYQKKLIEQPATP